ncbi:class I SAM-dependent methyltransferase [Spirosoma jeollabukense]
MTATNPFQRYDETDDRQFYRQPRLVNHIDEAALRATINLYAEYLPTGGNILDLMSSWVSHLPTNIPYGRVAGLGMNEVELKVNPQLTEYVVQNLNQLPRLCYGDNTFDGGMVTVSVQYLTQPVLVYQEMARVLRPGSPFLTVFSNRLFATKAVAIWQSLDDQGHQQLVRWYYEQTGLFGHIKVLDRSPGGGRDPLFAVVGWVKNETDSTADSYGIGSISH